MVLRHASTPTQRAQWISQLISGSGVYGVVSALSRSAKVSRQTLYTWKAAGLTALAAVFAPPRVAALPLGWERAVLTLWVAGHASERGIQSCLEELG